MADKSRLPLYEDEARQDLQDRLGKIEGQVRGVGRMIEGQRPTQEVLQQLASIRSAVKGLTKAVMRNYLEKCAVQVVGSGDSEAIEEMLETLTKFVKE
jgi:CsoR family transcriptional regulator, copper-sensing transcriptional repressor